MELDLTSSESAEMWLITVRGDVDLYSSPELRSAILKAVPKAKQEVGVDLAGVGYMDSSGVATLVEGLRAARRKNKVFRIVKPSVAVMKVLRLSRLEDIFDLSGTP